MNNYKNYKNSKKIISNSIEFSDIIPETKSRNIFDEIDEKVKQMMENGKSVYDCGVLDPAKSVGMPSFIYEGIEDFIGENHVFGKPGYGYPGNKGESWFLNAAKSYLDRHFGIGCDDETPLISHSDDDCVDDNYTNDNSANMHLSFNITNGSKTDEFIFARTLVNSISFSNTSHTPNTLDTPDTFDDSKNSMYNSLYSNHSENKTLNNEKSDNNTSDIVICPTPGYPAFRQGAAFISANIYLSELNEDFLIDFEKIPEKIARKAKIIWINYPNSPTGRIAPMEWLQKLVKWAHDRNIVIASDEAYIDFFTSTENTQKVIKAFSQYRHSAYELEISYSETSQAISSQSASSRTPVSQELISQVDLQKGYEIVRNMLRSGDLKKYLGHSILNITHKNVIAFFSMSKRSNMSGSRVGFCAGDSRIISAFYKVKNMHDDGVPQFIQKMSENALNDDEHVIVARELYNYCRYIWTCALSYYVKCIEKHAEYAYKYRGKAGYEKFERDSCRDDVEFWQNFESVGGLFLWKKTPKDISDYDFADSLLNLGIIVMPGSVFDKNMNGFVRIALSCDVKFIHDVEKIIISAAKNS